jgi:hypothetical protein
MTDDSSHAECDNPTCGYGYDSRTGMDHWVGVTEYDTNALTDWGYCSRKCMLDHQTEVLQE